MPNDLKSVIIIYRKRIFGGAKGLENLDKKKAAGLIAICVLVVAIIIAAIDAGKSLKKDLTETPNVSQSARPQKEDKNVKVKITSSMIRESLGDMGTLVTADYSCTQVETYSKTKTLFYVYDSNTSFVYSYDGVVYAGVDFTKIKVERNDVNKQIIIEVPDADITSVEIDYDSFKVYSEKQGIFNPLKIEDYNDAQKSFDEKARTLAKEKGIIKKAEDNAKTIIETFVYSLMEDEEGYEVVFK